MGHWGVASLYALGKVRFGGLCCSNLGWLHLCVKLQSFLTTYMSISEIFPQGETFPPGTTMLRYVFNIRFRTQLWLSRENYGALVSITPECSASSWTNFFFSECIMSWYVLVWTCGSVVGRRVGVSECVISLNTIPMSLSDGKTPLSHVKLD